MSPKNLHDVRQSKIWTELIDKEDVTRLAWYQRRKEGDIKGESNRFEVFKKRLERNSIKPLNARQLPPIDEKRICKKSFKSFQRAIDKTSLDRANTLLRKSTNHEVFDMYPVEQPVRKLMYDGFSKEGKGRHQYLQSRRKTIPEKKYQFPLCSSWDYGWRLEDHIPKHAIEKPVYGRRAIVESDFFTRNELPKYHSDRHLKEDDARAYTLITN